MNGLRQLYPNSKTPEYRRGRLACRMGCIIRTLMNARYGMTAAEICQSVNFAMGWDYCQRTYLRDINAMIEAGELEECGIGGPHDNKFKYRLGPAWQAFLAQKLSA